MFFPNKLQLILQLPFSKLRLFHYRGKVFFLLSDFVPISVFESFYFTIILVDNSLFFIINVTLQIGNPEFKLIDKIFFVFLISSRNECQSVKAIQIGERKISPLNIFGNEFSSSNFISVTKFFTFRDKYRTILRPTHQVRQIWTNLKFNQNSSFPTPPNPSPYFQLCNRTLVQSNLKKFLLLLNEIREWPEVGSNTTLGCSKQNDI